MLIVTNKIAYACVVIDSNVITLDGFNKYYKYLKLVKRNALLTVKNKLDSLYHFWLWTLSNNVESDEDLHLYFMVLVRHAFFYTHQIAANINLQNTRLSKYVNMVIDNKANGNPEENEVIRTSAQVEIEDMLGWIEILKTVDEKRVDSSYISPILNADHALIKLVYDGLDLKQFKHESMQDASEKLFSILNMLSEKPEQTSLEIMDKKN